MTGEGSPDDAQLDILLRDLVGNVPAERVDAILLDLPPQRSRAKEEGAAVYLLPTSHDDGDIAGEDEGDRLATPIPIASRRNRRIAVWLSAAAAVIVVVSAFQALSNKESDDQVVAGAGPPVTATAPPPVDPLPQADPLPPTVTTTTTTPPVPLNTDQQSLLDAINVDRVGNARLPLAVDASAQAKAQAWADKIADQDRLSNSTIAQGLACFLAAGENVGLGDSVTAAQASFMASPNHRSNVLDPRWTHVGVGVSRADNRVYVVQVFITGC